MDKQPFTYQIDSSFLSTEIVLKGETPTKKYFVEGYISTIDEDSRNETLTPKAQEKILKCIKGRDIAFTMDLEHEEWYDAKGRTLDRPKNERIPVAKVVEAELRPRGVWCKAEINQDCDRFHNVWNSIKNGFLHSFSVAFYPLKVVRHSVAGILHTFIDDLDLINITMSGAPINPSATFKPVMKAAASSILAPTLNPNDAEASDSDLASHSLSLKGEVRMETEIKPAEPAPVAPVVAPVTPVTAPAEPTPAVPTAEQIATAQEQIKKEREALETEKADLVSRQTAFSKQQQTFQADTAPLIGPLATLKAEADENVRLKAEIAALKAENAKPVFKSQTWTQPKVEIQMVKKTPLDTIQ